MTIQEQKQENKRAKQADENELIYFQEWLEDIPSLKNWILERSIVEEEGEKL